MSVISGDLPDSSDWTKDVLRIKVFDPAHTVVLDSLKFQGPGWPTDPIVHSRAINADPAALENPFPTEPFGTLVLLNCKFEQHRATGVDGSGAQGGAILATGRTLILRDCAFIGNVAKHEGGTGPSGYGAGGAISLTRGMLRAARCRFDDNFAGYSGGAVACSESSASFANWDL